MESEGGLGPAHTIPVVFSFGQGLNAVLDHVLALGQKGLGSLLVGGPLRKADTLSSFMATF